MARFAIKLQKWLIADGQMSVGARDLLRRLKCEIDPDLPVSELSVAEQQLVEIARALQRRARLLVMDEPSAALSEAEIYELIGELVEYGVAIILISSEMPELIGLSDRIAVMQEGSLQGILPRAEATEERIMELALQFTG